MSISYKERAEFWKTAAHKNLDFLAEALAEVRELQCEVHTLKLLFGDPGHPPSEHFYGCSLADMVKDPDART